MKPNINIYNEDCLQAMRGMADNAFDLAIVDPPYGIGSYWMKQKHTQHYGNKKWNEQPPPPEYWAQLMRVSKNQIIWGGNYFAHELPVTNSWIIWEKGNNVEKTNTSECELAWTSFKIPMRKVFVQWSGGRKGNETGIKSIHPCQRPVKLHKWTLTKYASEGDLILDTHVGSASIAIACHDLGFDLEAYEIDRDYWQGGCKRLELHRSQLTINEQDKHSSDMKNDGELTPEQANVRQSLALVEIDPEVLQICVDAYKEGERLEAIKTLIEEARKVYTFGIKQAKEWFEANVA